MRKTKVFERSGWKTKCWNINKPGANNGAWDTKKKCKRGNGTKLTPILRKSPFNLPLNRNDAVIPDITMEITQFKSEYFGSFCF